MGPKRILKLGIFRKRNVLWVQSGFVVGLHFDEKKNSAPQHQNRGLYFTKIKGGSINITPDVVCPLQSMAAISHTLSLFYYYFNLKVKIKY